MHDGEFARHHSARAARCLFRHLYVRVRVLIDVDQRDRVRQRLSLKDACVMLMEVEDALVFYDLIGPDTLRLPMVDGFVVELRTHFEYQCIDSYRVLERPPQNTPLGGEHSESALDRDAVAAEIVVEAQHLLVELVVLRLHLSQLTGGERSQVLVAANGDVRFV